MASRERYLLPQVERDLAKKMVFVAGPRQVGKTTLARHVLGDRAGYLNWEVSKDQYRILRRDLPPASPWVFDEIHKFRSWRAFLKGLYDCRAPGQQILVTGSAQLDYYAHRGDSLQGRYHLLRLHPLSVAELKLETRNDFVALIWVGGFPEPYFGAGEVEARRWSRAYRHLLVHEEVASLERRITDLVRLERLLATLPKCVGAPLPLNALRKELGVTQGTVAHWVDVLERTYGLFRLLPFGAPGLRAVKKQQKHYHFDWSLVREKGARFENLVAAHLLKRVQFEQDTKGRDLELRFFRDIDGREVDFVIVEERRPLMFVDCTWGDEAVGRSIAYLAARFPHVPAFQISAVGDKDYLGRNGIRVTPALTFLRTLV